MIQKIFELLVNALNTDDKYSLLHRDNLMQPVQMPISNKQKKVSDFFLAFLKTRSSFEHFQTKDDRHSFYIYEITDCERCAQISV